MRRNLRKIFFLILLFRFTGFAQDTTVVEFNVVTRRLPFGLQAHVLSNLPKIGIALSGGGARSLAQLGALAAFEKSGLPIYSVAGTSMGSIIGGLYSCGYSIDELKKIMFGTNWDKFTNSHEVQRRELYLEQKLTEDRSIISFRLKGVKPVLPTSINTGQNISNFLNSLVFNAPLHTNNFSSLPVKFAAVATNLINGKKDVLTHGSLTTAMRASSSVSFLLPPVSVDSLLLVDGGLVENLPVETARQTNADIVVGVNTISPLRTKEELQYPWQIAEQIVSIPMEILAKQEKNKADFVIEPQLGLRSNTDFSNLKELFNRGFFAAQKVIPEIKRKFVEEFKSKLKSVKTFTNLTLARDANELEKRVFAELPDTSVVSSADILLALYRSVDLNRFSKLRIEVISNGENKHLKIIYKYNPKIEKISLSGTQSDYYTPVYSILEKLIGKNYSASEVYKSLLQVLRFYRKKGLSLTDMKSVKFNDGLLSVELDEGIVKEVKITGNNQTNIGVVRREIPILTGKPFNLLQLKESLRNLQTTNLFKEIEAELVNGREGKTIVFHLKEKIPGALRFGLRIDNEYYTQIIVDLRNENLFGTGTQAGLIFYGGIRSRGLTFEHKANRVFSTYFTYKFKVYRNFRDVFNYSNDKNAGERKISRVRGGEYRQIYTGVSLGFGTQTKKFGNLIVEGRYEQDEVKNKVNYTGETFKLNIAAIKLNLNIDSQDKYPFPTNGFLVNAFYETAQKSLGGGVGYTKFFLDYKSYFSPVDWSTVSTRFRFGFSDPTLPLSQQFALGGEDSFFGMHEYEYRGRQIFAASLGYRVKLPVKIFFDTYLKFRYDIGSIWANREQIRLKDLKHGIGATLSFDTPIGPANFSVGNSFVIRNKLEKNIISWSPFFFYFSIGVRY